jgi:hypothetical protein
VFGNSSTTARTIGLKIDSRVNADGTGDAEVTATSGAVAAGTFPTGWSVLRGTTNYNPTGPADATIRALAPGPTIRKGSSSTDALMVALAGIYAETAPALPPPPPPVRTRLQAVSRVSNY